MARLLGNGLTGGVGGMSPSTEANGTMDVYQEFMRRLLAGWRPLLIGPLASGVVFAAVSLVLPQWFRATASLVVEQESSTGLPSGLTSIADQFGLPLPTEGSVSPRFYGELLESRALLEGVLVSRVPTEPGGDSVEVLSLLQVRRRGRNRADSLELGVRRLRKLVDVTVDQKADMVTIAAEAKSPYLAAHIANTLLDLLDDFNARVRQTRARRRREFLSGRLDGVAAELRVAEEGVRTFYEDNRDFRESPMLVAREARLQRQVQIALEVYLSLRRSFESARIDEVNDIPAVTVIDDAVPPQRRAWPVRWLVTLIGAGLGGVVALGWLSLTDWGGAPLGSPARQSPEGAAPGGSAGAAGG